MQMSPKIQQIPAGVMRVDGTSFELINLRFFR